MKVGHCTVSMSRDDTYEEGREWRRTILDRFLSSNCYFLCCLPPEPPGDPVKIRQLNRENKRMKYTRAKKLVWQSSKLAPLVCEFGWAICVYGGKSGREVYARSHTALYTHTLNTHTQRRVYEADVELSMQLYTFPTQSNGLFPSSMSTIMACNVFTL